MTKKTAERIPKTLNLQLILVEFKLLTKSLLFFQYKYKKTAVRNIDGLKIKYCGKVLEALLIERLPSKQGIEKPDLPI